MDTSLPGVSSRYFQHDTSNDNLNSSRGLAGLDDVSLGMDDDTTPMRFPPSESDEMLMGIKGGEFLADDSAMGFDTPLVSKTVKTRSRLNQSTTVPPAVSEEPEPEIEQPAKVEKPKRKKSTRSRSTSPTKKQSIPESTPETIEEPAFPRAQMEAMAEEPEPEPEPEPVAKPRRTSPRKPRTRPPSVADPLPAFPSARSSGSPFAPAPTAPTPEPAPAPVTEPEPIPEPVPQPIETEPEAEPAPAPAAKPKRTSRTVGRSKSKTRSKSTRTEETENQGLGSSEKESSPAVAEEETPAPTVQQTLPSVVESPPPATVMEKAKSPPAQEPASRKPAATVRHSIATGQAPESHTRVQSGPAPFKFHTRPSVAKSRNKSMSFTPPSSSPPVSAAAPTLDTHGDVPAAKEEPREPTKEEEAEAIAAAMRITRRDSLVFPRPGQPYSFNLLNEPIQNGDEPIPMPTGEEPVEAEPGHKRTRVGRRSTRTRGGASAVTGRGGLDEKIEEEEQGLAPEQSAPVVEEVISEPAAPSVEEATSAEAQAEAGAIDEDVPMEEDEPEAMEDVVVPVNFGSRSPSPAPTPAENNASTPPTNEAASSPSTAVVAPTPKANMPKAASAPAKGRTTRASLPAQTSRVSAPATRSSRRSEGRPVVTRTGSGMGPSRQKKEAIIEEKDEEEEAHTLKEEAGVEENAVTELAETATIPEVPFEEVVEPIAPADVTEPTETAPIPTEALEAEPEPELEPAEDVPTKPASRKTGTQQKALGVSAAKGPQRAGQRSATTSTQGTASTGPQRSGARAPRVASDSQKPSSAKPASTTSAPMRATVSAPLWSAPTKAAAPSSGPGSTAATTGRPQRVVSSQKPNSATSVPQKPSSSASQKPASSQKSGAPARAAVSKAKSGFSKEPSPVVGKDLQAGPSKVIAEAPNTRAGVRATRALPKRAARMSKEQKAASLESGAKVALAEPVEEKMEPESTNDEVIMDEQAKLDSPKPSANDANLAWLNAAAGASLNQPDTSNASASLDAETSNPFGSNKRRASTPESNAGVDAFESPSKRVRFSANLEAGPTPGPSKPAAQRQPRSSLKVKAIAKPKFQLKAGRPKPKRTLTRDKVPDAMPSYAAPLKRTVSEKVEMESADSEKQRPPLVESQTNTRSAVDKPKPTVPVAFTFRSEMRLKPHVPEAPLPAAIPIALPMPDFAAAHAAAEAANLARRERAQAAFLEAQEALESWRQSKHEIGSETARRAAERAVFDAAMKVKEAEAERERVEARRLEEEREAIEIKEMRKRMVPKANPVPEFYKHLAHGGDETSEAVEA
ncbi:hypothetical protein BDV93DRAFT_519306 [Ceratobasidium sp. AG-I]|nr:hypothetical protein BDV93DRAFT_519306 [Ceratobasidium sp. AG-I]